MENGSYLVYAKFGIMILRCCVLLCSCSGGFLVYCYIVT